MKWVRLNEKSDRLYEKLFGNKTKGQEDQALEELADHLQDSHYLSNKLKQQESYDHEKAFRRLMHFDRKMVWRKYSRLAAVMLLPLGIGMLILFTLKEGKEKEKILSEMSYTNWVDIKPGEHKAFLKMHNGLELKLTRDSARYQEGNGARINIDSTGLHYDVSTVEKEDEVIYNTLIVPRGGEFFLTLADGSKVWLNADSELKYPVNFEKNSRRVKLKGEAYFEVTKAAKWPFVVEMELGAIEVLGTEFNVRNYAGNDKLTATLVKGSIAYTQPQGEQFLLKPDQRLVAEKDGKVKIEKIDPRFSVGWKDGMFLFRDERLEDIMEQLSRWYDVGVFYTCEPVKNLHFSGDLGRYRSIDTFIEMFAKSSDAKFSLNGKTLIIGL